MVYKVAVFVVLDGGRSWALFGPAVSVSARAIPSEWTQFGTPVFASARHSVHVVERRGAVVADGRCRSGSHRHPCPSEEGVRRCIQEGPSQPIAPPCVSRHVSSTATNHPPPRNPGGETTRVTRGQENTCVSTGRTYECVGGGRGG